MKKKIKIKKFECKWCTKMISNRQRCKPFYGADGCCSQECSDNATITLDNIAYEIGEGCTRYARLQVRQTKEKFGTVRVYCSFGCSNLHELVYPGYCYIQFPRLYSLFTYPFLKFVEPLIIKWQQIVYRFYYAKAVVTYPKLRDNILSACDHPEHLEGL